MSMSRRTKVVLLGSAVVVVSLAAGFVLGAASAKVVMKKKEDPAIWKPAAMKHLEKLHPTDAQRARFETIVDQAVAELTAIRTDTAARANAIVTAALSNLDLELTAQQREQFAKMKPKKDATQPSR
jgi:Spy/CpxP family protein refolding chaperone